MTEEEFGSGDYEVDAFVGVYKSILKTCGLSQCPFNVSACRFAYEACEEMKKVSQETDIGFRILYSENISTPELEHTPLLFMGIQWPSGQFTPVMLVMTSELLASDGFGVYCGGDECSHATCEAMPEGLRRPAATPRSRLAGGSDINAEVNRLFARMVNNVDAEMPKFNDLARFYDVPKDEGG